RMRMDGSRIGVRDDGEGETTPSLLRSGRKPSPAALRASTSPLRREAKEAVRVPPGLTNKKDPADFSAGPRVAQTSLGLPGALQEQVERPAATVDVRAGDVIEVRVDVGVEDVADEVETGHRRVGGGEANAPSINVEAVEIIRTVIAGVTARERRPQ